MDCWAFRTRLTVADIADMVGTILQRNINVAGSGRKEV